MSSGYAIKTKYEGNALVIDGVRDFDCRQIFECGQCFRWEAMPDGSYSGFAGGRRASVRFELSGEDPAGNSFGRVLISGGDGTDALDPGFWIRYLDLERDYGAIKARLTADDPVMAEAVRFGSGIRILDQDLWETIVSFIISQNNNIPRIKGCIERLSETFGEKRPGGYEIPSAEVLAGLSVEDLAPVRLGYRARYLIETARCVVERGLPKDMEELSSLCGVGPKVANCIALFGMGIRDSFPIDVWVRRVMAECYGFDEKDMKGMAVFAREKFGELGGYAQQYLFYYIRERSVKNTPANG